MVDNIWYMKAVTVVLPDDPVTPIIIGFIRLILSFAALYNSLSPTFRTNYLVHKYFPGKDNYWSLSVVLSNFEHIEEGLEVITKSFMVFMPQE